MDSLQELFTRIIERTRTRDKSYNPDRKRGGERNKYNPDSGKRKQAAIAAYRSEHAKTNRTENR